MNAGSLFAGIGGIDLAFKQAGFNILWAIEKDEKCAQTYRHNFRERLIVTDIRDVSPCQLPHVDILLAGFPCQSFSVAGNQLGFEDARGTLFYEVARFVKEIAPKVVFLENVANLLEHDQGKTFLIIHNILSDLGYSIRYRVMKTSEYSELPQLRERIYIVAFKDLEDSDAFLFPKKADIQKSIEEIVIRSIKQNDIYYLNNEDAEYDRIQRVVIRKDCIYRVYNGDIRPICNNMCPTLTATMGTRKNHVPFVRDAYGIRKLTLRECLDFQGFPKVFYFPNTISINDAYKQIGNSVCVPVVRKIAEQIKRAIK